MNSSMRSVLACEKSPCKPSRFGFLARRLSKRHLFDSQKTAAHVNNVLPEKEGTDVGAFTLTWSEKIERARSAACAARRKRQATVPAGRQNTPLEKLEDKLLEEENRCLELRQKIEVKKQEVPARRDMARRRTLSSSHLALKQRAPTPDSDGDILKALEAFESFLLSKEEECADLRQQAQLEASKRGRPGRSMAGRPVVSMSCLSSQPLKPALRKEESSFRSAKSVSWGQL
jgi:hypothetical protein